jgi:hypothetical protein
LLVTISADYRRGHWALQMPRSEGGVIKIGSLGKGAIPMNSIGSGELRPSRNVSAAKWLIERLWGWHWEQHPPIRVGSFMPSGFEAYARIFHPIWVNREARWIRWSELAERNDQLVHPEISFWELVRPRDAGPWSIHDRDGINAVEGSLAEDLCARLAEILAPFTAAAHKCWFAVWEGWGDLPAELEALPKAEAPLSRRYVLFSGPLVAIRSLRWGLRFQSPSLWWPDDQAWCVSTEIDDCSTFVASSDRCIDTVVAESALESMRTSVEARGDFGPYPPRDN